MGIELSEHKKLLFRRLQQEARRQATRTPGVCPRADRATYPLSFAQQRLWLLEQLHPGSAAWRVTLAVHLEGTLHLEVLRQCLQELPRRHESLRATFAPAEHNPGVARQTLVPAREVPLRVLGPEGQAPGGEQAWVQARQRLLACGPDACDLARGPLLAGTLLRLDEVRCLLGLSSHAIVADHASLALLAHELLRLYDGIVGGRSVSLPDLPLDHADYAAWQQQRLEGQELAGLQEYWRQASGDVPLTLNLPFDAYRPAGVAPCPAEQACMLDKELVRRARALCDEEELPLPVLLCGALALLLCQYTGQRELLLGYLDSERAPELAGVVGPLTAALPVRVHPAGQATGRTFLRDLGQSLTGARAHRDLPLERIVEVVAPQHDLSRLPLFGASVACYRFPSCEAAGLAARLVPLCAAPGEPLACVFADDGRGVRLSLTYDGTLFAASSLARLQEHYVQLLHTLLQHLDEPLASLSCLTGGERTRLLQDWNAVPSTPPPPDGCCLHQLVEQQVRRTPQAIALSDGEGCLTYRQMNARANRLARVLRRRGVGPEDLVGLCLARSPDLVVGLLAILKAGAAYVPLDPAYPRERLALTIEDASLALVLTERGQGLPIPAGRTLCLEDVALAQEMEEEDGEDDDDCPWAIGSEQLAYVIYTSGSTGRPKGVCITHRSAVQFLRWTREQFTDDELAAVLCSTSLCFDLSIFEIFAPLCRGGRAVLAASALELPRLAVCETITLLNTVPSAAAALLGSGPLPTSVQTINLAGEALTRDLVQALYRQPGVRRVCNLYGPTEDTTYSTWITTRADEQGAVPIGSPLPGTQAYILDEQLRLAPIGIVGELYLGGEGLARGYLRRPDLTAERFLPDHVSGVPGRRLYRTGDLARCRADGVIDYLGRIDHQVKIRGFRVELGEIEARLRQQQGVAEAMVLARRAAGGEQSLVAYVVPRPGAEVRPEPALLRRHLQELLPAYMIPAFFVVLARFPLTPNGKVDRGALPAPDGSGEAVELSAGGGEQWLARLWQELFPRASLRRHADFFALGGDSLQLLRLLARLHRSGQTHLGPGDLYTAPTIAAQAALLRAPVAPVFDLVPCAGGEAPEGPLPLSFAQQHIWTQDQLTGSPGVYHVPLILALDGALDALALYQALYEVMRRHDALRASVRLLRGSPVLYVSRTPQPDLVAVDLPLAAPGAAPEDLDTHPQVLRAIQEEIMRPFDLCAGPLLRVRLLRVQRDHTILVCTMHQLVSDDWSLHLFWQELVELYNAFRAGRPSPLAQPGLQYREMIAWQQARWPVYGPGDLACWQERLTPLPPALALPTDAPRPAVQTCEGATFHARISPALLRQLHATGRREGATLSMLLLTALLLLLARSSGQEDLVIGTAVAGRPRPEMERMIGLCAHALPLRVPLAGCSSVRDLLGRVRAAMLSACEHQAPSLEQLIEVLRPQTDPSRAPLFQVFFALQYAPPAEVRFAGLRARRLELWPPTSEFDLSCLLEERPYGLNLTLRYSTRLFTRATIERFQEQYQELVQGLSALLDSPVQAVCGPAALPFAPGAEEEEEEKEEEAEATEAGGEEGILLQGPLEEELAALWQTVLGRTGIARSEHFFEIGGHSLLAMQVLVAVRERLQVALTLRQFFDAPTLAELAHLVEQARAGQQACAERLLPVARNRELPLSFAQQRLWFLDQLEGASATYTMPAVLRLSGQLDLPVFQRSLRELARRHEALRTTFVQEQGGPVQCIHRLPFPVLSVVDAPAGDTAHQRQEALLAEIGAEVRRPFDLARGPLLRVRVLLQGPGEQIVVFTMHHIISDGWSLGIIARELGALYNAFLAGRPSPLPELPLQYADFAAWQQASVQGPRLAASLRYWEQRLRGAPTLQLPTDRPRQASATMPGATCAEQWPQVFTQELLEFSTRRGLTLFMTLLAGFLALLSYHSGQEDITVGTPVANRPHPDLERLVGLFVNTLALRLDLAGDPGGDELCRRVREMTLDAYEHQDAPFEQIVESIRPRRQAGRTPIFQVMFAFQNAPTASLELSGLQVHSVDTHTSTAKFDLSVSLEMHDEGLVVGTEYSTQLFEAATIQRFHQQYRALLERLIRHPQQPLSWVYRGLAGPGAKREEQDPCTPTSGRNCCP